VHLAWGRAGHVASARLALSFSRPGRALILPHCAVSPDPRTSPRSRTRQVLVLFVLILSQHKKHVQHDSSSASVSLYYTFSLLVLDGSLGLLLFWGLRLPKYSTVTFAVFCRVAIIAADVQYWFVAVSAMLFVYGLVVIPGFAEVLYPVRSASDAMAYALKKLEPQVLAPRQLPSRRLVVFAATVLALVVATFGAMTALMSRSSDFPSVPFHRFQVSQADVGKAALLYTLQLWLTRLLLRGMDYLLPVSPPATFSGFEGVWVWYAFSADCAALCARRGKGPRCPCSTYHTLRLLPWNPCTIWKDVKTELSAIVAFVKPAFVRAPKASSERRRLALVLIYILSAAMGLVVLDVLNSNSQGAVRGFVNAHVICQQQKLALDFVALLHVPWRGCPIANALVMPVRALVASGWPPPPCPPARPNPLVARCPV
jgi:hypothetical protein